MLQLINNLPESIIIPMHVSDELTAVHGPVDAFFAPFCHAYLALDLVLLAFSLSVLSHQVINRAYGVRVITLVNRIFVVALCRY